MVTGSSIRSTPINKVEDLADRVLTESRFPITDRKSFDMAFEQVTDLTEEDMSSEQLELRNKVFNFVARMDKRVRKERQADRKEPKEVKEKKPVRAKKQFDVDFAGIKKTPKQLRKDLKKSAFKETATVRAVSKTGKIIRAREQVIKVRGVSKIVLRDSKGRFVRRLK